MIRYIIAFALAAALVAPTMAQDTATSNMDILRQKIKADKKLVVAENLNLTDTEGTEEARAVHSNESSRSVEPTAG